jgi:hypothetical protein
MTSNLPNSLKISGEQLVEFVKENPDWLEENATAERPVEIFGSVDLTGEKIRRLSPHAIFHGYNPGEDRHWTGYPIIFTHCTELENAAGVFLQPVNFSGSGVKTIDPNLRVYSPEGSTSANYTHCYRLEAADGWYERGVSYNECSIKKINDTFHVENPNREGTAAVFKGCSALKELRGTYNGWVTAADSGIVITRDFVVTQPNKNGAAANLSGCESLRHSQITTAGKVTYKAGSVEIVDVKIIPPQFTHDPKEKESAFLAGQRIGEILSDGEFRVGEYTTGEFTINLLECPNIRYCNPEHLEANIVKMENPEKLLQKIKSAELLRKPKSQENLEI